MGFLHSTVVALMLAVLVAGCSEPGMNKKLAMSDAIGVTATGVALDESKDFNKVRAEVIEVATALNSFVSDGKLSDLPLDSVRKLMVNFLIKKNWNNYVYLVDSAMTYVKAASVSTDKIGTNNLAIIHAALEGVIRQADRSKAEWATPIR